MKFDISYLVCTNFLITFIATIFAVNCNLKAQETNLDVIHSRGDYWLSYTNAPNSLYQYITNGAIELIDKRSSEISEMQSLYDWKQRQKWIKKTLNNIVGPFPGKTSLNAKVQKVIYKKYFRVEHIIFESQPKFYVTSSLYLPTNKKKLPVIIFCSGHTMEGYRNNTYQHIILNLVKKGFAVFAFDPVGQGERIEYYDAQTGASLFGSVTREHSYPGTQTLITGLSQARFMIWDGIRALDYLFTRNEIDTNRIGITGASGGGTQSALIAAVDERIYASAPERYITNFKRLFQSIGPTDAEQSLFHSVFRGIDHADLLSVRAPKPNLIITTTNDFFSIQGSRETAIEVSKIYNAYKKPSNFEIVEDVAGHNSTQKNREAMYAFFQNHLKNPGISIDQNVTFLTSDEMQVTRTGQVSTSMKGETVFSLNRIEADKCVTELNLSRCHLEDHLTRITETARYLSGFHQPLEYNQPVFTGRVERESYVIDKYFVKGEGDYVIPYLLFVPNRPSNKALIYLHPSGKDKEANIGGEIEFFVERGITVLAPDLLGCGEIGINHLRGSAVFDSININIWYGSMMIGRSIVGIRAGDVVRLVGILNTKSITEIFGLSRQEMSPVLLHAAAFDLNISRIALVEPLSSYRQIVMNRFYNPKFIYGTVAGALENYDLPDLAASLAPRKLLMINVTDENSNFLTPQVIKKENEIVYKSFQISDAYDKLNIVFSSSNKSYNDDYLKWIQ